MTKRKTEFLQLFADDATASAQGADAPSSIPEQGEEKKTASGEPRNKEGASRYAEWVRQAQEARGVYPALDLEKETQNPAFRRMLMSGVDVGTAYLACHKDEILPMAMQYAARTVEKKLMSKMLAGGIPSENGVAPGGATLVQNDVSSMTKEQRREIIRRVGRGEKIRF